MHYGQIPRLFLVALMLSFLTGVRTVAAETVAIEWDPNPEAEVVGYRVFIGAHPGIYDSQVDVGNVTSYSLGTLQAGRRYCFAVAAFAAGPVVGNRSAEVCTDTNKPPTLQNPGSQANQVGVAITLQMVGADPESSPVTYSAIGLPTGLTINTNTGFLSGTPTTAGTFSVQATISDGKLSTTQTFSWTIGAALPDVATPLRPSGAVASNTPTFEWESLATATTYRLWVDDASATNPKIEIDYTPAQAGCSTAGAVCQANPGIALAVGSASWSIRASNASGAGPWSGAMDFMVPDTKVPLIAIAAPTANTTFSTTTGVIAMAGTASDDQAVTEVTWTNNRGGSGTATGTTSWAMSEVPLVVGVNVVTITARDAAGNSATDVLTVTRSDATAPTVKITAPTAGATHATAQTVMNLAGTASDDVEVTAVTWASDRGGQGTATGTTNWSVGSLPLSAGTNVVTVTAVDGAGNQSTAKLIVTADTVAPTVNITAPTTAATLTSGAATLELGGTASDDVEVTEVAWATDKGAGGVAVGTTSWSVPGVPLTAEVTVITVTAKDAAGRSSTQVLTVTRPDTTAPTVDITAPSAQATFSTTFETIFLAGTAADSVGVTQVSWTTSNGHGGIAAGTTSWSVAGVVLKPGVNVITVTARDAAGNVATDSVAVTLADVIAPVLTITAPTTLDTLISSAMSVALGGSASDLFGVTEVRWDNNRGGSGVATGTTGWSVPAVALQSGANVITVTARDAAGNTASRSITVTPDRSAPVVAISTPAESGRLVTRDAVVTVGGTATDEVGVTELTWANSRGGSGTISSETSWRTAVPVVDGVNVITVTAQDAAGNRSSATLSVTRDSMAPFIAIRAPARSGTVVLKLTPAVMRGTSVDNERVTQVTWENSRGDRGVASGTSDWTIPSLALQAGANVITVTAHDAAGNTRSDSLTLALDEKPPVVSISTPTSAPTLTTSQNQLILRGSVTDDTEVDQLSWTNSQGGGAVLSGRASWADEVALRPGLNTITVTARDAAGRIGTAMLEVRVTDVKAPTVTILSPTSAGRFSAEAGTINLGGKWTDDFGPVQATWASDRGGQGVASASGTDRWTVSGVALQPGLNVITVTSTDAAGNTSSDTAEITVGSGAPAILPPSATTASSYKSAAASVTPNVTNTDSTAPVLTVYAPTAATTFTTAANRVTIGGTATDAVGVTEVSWTNSQGGSGVAFGTSGWGVSEVPLASGVNVLTVRARDAAGNTAVKVLTITSTGSSSGQLSASLSPAPR